MEQTTTAKLPNPTSTASWFSIATYAWLAKTFYKACKEGLQLEDLYRIKRCDESQVVTEKLAENWKNEINKAKINNTKPNLRVALLKTFWWQLFRLGIVSFLLYAGLKSFLSLILSYIVSQFSNEAVGNRLKEKYVSGAILTFCLLLASFMVHHSSYGLSAVGMRMRVAVSSLVFRKTLVLSQKSLGQTAAGQVINLLANDVTRFDIFAFLSNYLWISPIQFVVVAYLAWRQGGKASFAGLGALILLTLPLQALMARKASQLRFKIAQATDRRVKLINEIVTGIQVIKMYTWEKPFERLVTLARNAELKSIKAASYIRGIYTSSSIYVERTGLALTVITYILVEGIIRANQVFSIAQLFNVLQLSIAVLLPVAISSGAEIVISIRRLQDFLTLEERQTSEIDTDESGEIVLQDVTASWVQEIKILKDVNINIAPGSLCAIVGPVGAGKSSILHLLLGELPAKSGHIRVGGSISYASQEPWLFASTVRNNILFGLDYDRVRYKKTVKFCALKTDFEQLPRGDKTVVGDKGVSLSGGQKARINLARAVYRDADIYLFDDPLSAVDTHVGKHLFEGCILEHLAGKTRVLVTHQLQYLKKADHIVVINNKRVEAQGTFEELSNSILNFTKMLKAADDSEFEEKSVSKKKVSVLSTASFRSIVSEVSEMVDPEESYESETKNILRTYLTTGNSWFVLISLIVALIIGQVFCTSGDLFVTLWTDRLEKQYDILTKNSTNIQPNFTINSKPNSLEGSRYFYAIGNSSRDIQDTQLIQERNFSIIIYVTLIVLTIIATISRTFFFFKVTVNSSHKVHAKSFLSLLKAPMVFFDTNPSGRILNRFSKDVGAIDEILPRYFLEATQIGLVLLGIVVNMVYTNYYLVIIVIVWAYAIVKLRVAYLVTARQLKHLEGNVKSPVFSLVNSSINGITTIRACQSEEKLKKQFDSFQDVHSSAWTLILHCMSGFGLWMDLLIVVFIGFVIISFIETSPSASLVGLALSQGLILSDMLQYGMRQSSEVSNNLISVERVLQYTKLEKDEDSDLQKSKISLESWPNRGKIVFENLYLFYSANDPPVLKNLSFVVQPGEKIGIVGRTGAGKSSLISALFRLSPTQGKILIDGVDTKSIALENLRKKISIIPQEPVLFSATLRYNLDPFDEYDDEKIWDALEEVELKDVVSSLDFPITEGGSNFSVGQRQLVCLARAILRENKILVMDEVTANVDPQTDQFIQKAMKTKFAASTVLTIAHRLNTIMDSDKVLVMEAGNVIQYDHPYILLQNPTGHFYKMVEQTGFSMSQQLHRIAKIAFKNRSLDTKL